MSERKISVIIPTRNETGKIEQCLKAVFSQSLKPYEVIIVDGHSTDETTQRAKNFPVKILYEDFGGRAGACQIGIENAQGDYVAFTDADCIPSRNWLEQLLNEFGSQIVGVGGGVKSIGDTLWEKSFNLAFNSFLGSARSLQGRFFVNNRFVNSISGSNSMYLKEDILAVGGFNTNLKGAEDLELNRRLLSKGKLLYTPKAVVIHSHSWTFKEFAKKMYRYGKERGIVKKRDLQIIPALVFPLLLLSLLFTPWIIIGTVCVYLLTITLTGLRFAAREKIGKLVVSIPVTYLVEHVFYSFGLWQGWIQSLFVNLPSKNKR